MEEEDQCILAALRVVIRSSHTTAPDGVPAVVDAAGRELGAARAAVWVVDYDQVTLSPLATGGYSERSLPVDGSLAGRAFSHVTVQRGTDDGEETVWVPVVDGTSRLGVLELVFAEQPTGQRVDDTACQDLGAVIADLVITRSRYGDAIEHAKRHTPLSVPAEMAWHLMPPLSFVTGAASIAAAVGPATQIAGDAFDYSFEGNMLHVAVLDAMGHSLQSTLMAAVAISALRNARRRGRSLAEIVSDVDDLLNRQFAPEQFVTGIVGQLNTRTGAWTWVTCGHPPALIVRNGKVVKTLDSVIGAPLGLGLLRGDPEADTERLQPGDRLLLYTDGVIEARDAAGEQFGTGRLAHLLGKEFTPDRRAAEALRRLNVAILAHQHGILQDDATTVMVEWHG